MAEVVNTNVFDANKKFIDLAGLDYFWDQAKLYVDGVDAQLTGKITTLETVLGDASNGIVKEVADLRAEVSALGNVEGGQGIGGMIDAKINALDLPNTYDAKGAADAALTDAKAYVDGRFNDEVTGKFDTVGSAAAVQGNLDSHAADAVAHVTADERADWNAAKAAIDTFLKDADMTADAVDTLAELQTYMNNDGAAATQLVNRVAALEAVKDDYKAADTALETSLKGYVDGKDSAMDARVKVVEGRDVYVKTDVDAAIADAKKAGTDAAAALDAYKPVIEQSVTDAKAAAIAKAAEDAAKALENYYTKTEVDGLVAGAKTYADGLKTTIDGVIAENERVTSKALTDLDTRVKVIEDQDVYVKDDVDTAVADAKKAGTDAAAALEAYKAVVSQALADNSSADQAYAKTYTDALFTSFTFAGDTDIDGIFKA